MGYTNHVLVQFGGTIGPAGAPFEQWSCGIRVRTENGLGVGVNLDVDSSQEYLNNTVAPALADFTASNPWFSSSARITFIKCNAIDNDGHYLNPTTVEYNVPSGDQAFDGTPLIYPSQVSLVATLETDIRRGFANRGRIYLPCPSAVINPTTGTLAQDQVQQVAERVASMVQDLNTEDITLGITFIPSVISKSGGTNGKWNPITAVSVDTVLDTQRRRANDIRGQRGRSTVG